MSKKNIQRRVVSYSEHLNQFAHLPSQFMSSCGTMQILTHSKPRYEVLKDNVLQFNFDLGLITDTAELFRHGEPRSNISVPDYCNGIVCFPREHKFTQQLKMSALAKRLGLKHFRHIQTFATETNGNHNWALGQNPRGKVVIKPLDGARGIGQLVVNLDELLPGTLMLVLGKLGANTDEFLESMRGHAPHIEYHIGHGSVSEGLNMLKQGYCVQEMIADVDMEYRLILDINSRPQFIVERTRESLPLSSNEFGYRQATGSASTRNEIKVLSKLRYPHMREVTTLLKALTIPLNSTDLFITKDGRWGLFEYCPQWGTQGLPMTELTSWMIEQITTLLKRKELQA